MTMTAWGQDDVEVAFEWGPAGVQHFLEPQSLLVVVDVLSFTTSVTVLVERGTAVFPSRHASMADQAAAKSEADALGAALAVRRDQVSVDNPWSLSPSGLRDAPWTPRLVLPSPNGSTICSVPHDGRVLAACLRNADAVGRSMAREVAGGGRACVVAAGERWPDGSLRPALEDSFGAGAVIASLMQAMVEIDGRFLRLSPEAAAVHAMYAGTTDVSAAVRGCASAIELEEMGFGSDVDIALEVESSDLVPALRGGAFVAADRDATTRPASSHH